MLIKLGQFFFQRRDLLPLPLAGVMLAKATPSRFTWMLGLPLIFLGELWRIWALMHIGPTTRTRNICADHLVTTGPYRLCRNPLYLANLTKVAGLLTVAGNRLLLPGILAFYALEFVCMIAYEESFLRKKFPQEFSEYARVVPAFFPRLSGNLGTALYSMSEAIASEKRTFASTGILLLMLKLRELLRGRTVFRGEML